MSLNSQINETIKNWHGDFTLDDLASWCKKVGCKTATIERELRPSSSPNIISIWNKKETAIIAYRYSETPNSAITAPQTTTPIQSTCSPHCAFNTFKIHNRDCIANKEPEFKGLF